MVTSQELVACHQQQNLRRPLVRYESSSSASGRKTFFWSEKFLNGTVLCWLLNWSTPGLWRKPGFCCNKNYMDLSCSSMKPETRNQFTWSPSSCALVSQFRSFFSPRMRMKRRWLKSSTPVRGTVLPNRNWMELLSFEQFEARSRCTPCSKNSNPRKSCCGSYRRP